MTIRWNLTDELFNEALNRPPDERHAFLVAACGGDEDLLHEVESLLRYASDSGSYVQAVIDETIRDLRASLLRPSPPAARSQAMKA
jgi:hypothetical protein